MLMPSHKAHDVLEETKMNITIVGTGNMARGIATRALAGGNSVTLIGHESGKAEELAAALQSAVTSGATVQAASGTGLVGEVVVLAVPYPAAAAVVAQYGSQLAGKVVVDITNPIDFNTMSPTVAAGSSGAEEIAKAVPAGTKVVKAFNTTFAGTLTAGQVAGQPLDVLIAGDDADAKATVSQLVESGGLRAVDTGALNRARQLEALGLLHIALQFTGNTGFSTAVKLLP
jgi:8-hydroxy-5-deazaflavin:NADPH oxidoreductase